jgi:hypothetical protein|tara:strand:- start:1326 stop:1487 length:162 start_codon:yes stop_codon:yes gene_type:complete
VQGEIAFSSSKKDRGGTKNESFAMSNPSFLVLLWDKNPDRRFSGSGHAKFGLR